MQGLPIRMRTEGGSGENGWHFASSLLHWVSRVRCTYPLSGSISGVWGSIHNCTTKYYFVDIYQYGVSVLRTRYRLLYIYIHIIIIINKEGKQVNRVIDYRFLCVQIPNIVITGSPDYEVLFFMVARAELVRRWSVGRNAESGNCAVWSSSDNLTVTVTDSCRDMVWMENIHTEKVYYGG